MRGPLLRMLARLGPDENAGPTKRRLASWMLRNLPGMLTCSAFEEFVQEYYEGLLPDRVRRKFETHMQLCPMCRVHFDGYVRAVALGQRVCEDDESLPDGMPEELVGAILLARSREPGR